MDSTRLGNVNSNENELQPHKLERPNLSMYANNRRSAEIVPSFSRPTQALIFAYRETRLRRNGSVTWIRDAIKSAIPIAILSGVLTSMNVNAVANFSRDLIVVLFLAYELSGSIVITNDQDFLIASSLTGTNVIQARLGYALSNIVPMSIGFLLGASAKTSTIGELISTALQTVAVSVIAVLTSSLLCYYRRQRRTILLAVLVTGFLLLRSSTSIQLKLKQLIQFSNDLWIFLGISITVIAIVAISLTLLRKDPLAYNPSRSLRRIRHGFLRSKLPNFVALAATTFEEHVGIGYTFTIILVPLGILLVAMQETNLSHTGALNLTIRTLTKQNLNELLASSTITGALIWSIGSQVIKRLLPNPSSENFVREREFISSLPFSNRMKALSYSLWPSAVGFVLLAAITTFWYFKSGPFGAIGAISAGLIWVIGMPIVSSITIFSALFSRFTWISFLVGRISLFAIEVIALSFSVLALSLSITLFLIISFIVGASFCIFGISVSNLLFGLMLEARVC